ncbi:putative ribonuclease H-like domain-containing protein, partial [Tanacetum coccineum]
QFEIQKVWILVDLPYGKKAIGTKWVYRNKKDERGVVVRNKARLVAQGHRQEEGIDYDEATSTIEAEYVTAASCCGQVLKIHTDDNVADLLTKAFDVSRFQFLVVTIGMLAGLIVFRESFRRVTNGTEALLIPTLFILWLDKVSTDSLKFVPLGKVCTAIETLKKNTAKALISLSTTITLSNTMAILESCPKHNIVAYLEKTDGNAEFHDIIDFLTRNSIHHALTVSPVVSTTFVEQFWTSAKSKIINNVRHITTKVAGKPVVSI